MDHDIITTRAAYSRMRLSELRKRLSDLDEVAAFPGLSIFGAGSYARLEASEYSDIDLFFLSTGERDSVAEPRKASFQLFGKMIQVADKMNFPNFSNDCQYLKLIHETDIRSHLGSPRDDHENYFTTRMLLLLESKCIYGEANFKEVRAKIVGSYFKDYPDHKTTFEPMFLINDICRFWKTLLLNYENKRRLPEDEKRRTRQKVRNFKLKFSRLTTCFASIAALGSHATPVTEEQVVDLTALTPRERLESVAERMPAAKESVREVLQKYSWFLEMTGLPTPDLEAHFSDKQKRTEMFRHANEYGDAMFELLRTIDKEGQSSRLLRTLVI